MNTNAEQIKIIFEECETLYTKIMNNKVNINKILDNFIVNIPISDGVYSSYDGSKGYDISLPDSSEVYEEAIKVINSDVNDIELLISKNKEIQSLMKDASMDSELLEIGNKSIKMVQEIEEERENRYDLLDRIKKIYQLLEEQKEELAKAKEKEEDSKKQSGTQSASGAGSGGGGASGGGYSGGDSTGGGGGSSSSSNNNSNTNTSNNNGNNSNQPTIPNDYTPAVSFNLTNSDMSVAKSNLDSHAKNVANVLSQISINGQVIGGDVYGITGATDSSDIGFNFGTLQLALDAVDADVKAIDAYIEQMKTKIADNETSIEEKTAEMGKQEEVEGVDEHGKPYKYTRFVHSDAERATYQAEIEALKQENTQLEADIKSYTEEKTAKQGVFDQLVNLRNAYNQANGGLMNVYSASDLINALHESGGKGPLLGMELTDAQKQQLFNNMGNILVQNQDKYSLVTSENFNPTAGEFPLGAYQYILGCCAILGDSENTFQNNFQTMQDFRSKIAASLEYGEASSNGDASTDSDANKASQESSNPQSTKTLDPVVADFMNSNRGKVVTLSPEVKQALGLRMDAVISIPKGYDTSVDFPLLLWLAGTGTAGGDVNNLKTSLFVKNVVNGSYVIDGAIMYAPCGWGSGSADQNNSKYNPSMLDHDLDRIVEGLNVDKNHISGMGVSIGAFALAYLTTSHPNLFSAVALTGGGFDGAQNNNIHAADAIKNSPGTTFIWYVANNDYSSLYRNSEGVRSYTQRQHEELLAAGMNSVYYELEGDLWHTIACARFANDDMINDLIHINKGDRYSVPSGIVRVSSQDSANSAIEYGNNTNNWYIPLSSGSRSAGPAEAYRDYSKASTLEYRTDSNDVFKVDPSLPDVFKNVKGAIPDLTTVVNFAEYLPDPGITEKNTQLTTDDPTFYTEDGIEYHTARYTGTARNGEKNSGTDIWYAIIPKDKMPKLASASDDTTGHNNFRNPTSMAKDVDASIAVNASVSTGITYANGVLYKPNSENRGGETLIMRQDGTLDSVSNKANSTQDIVDMNPVWAVQGFFPIYKDGQFVSEHDDKSTDYIVNQRHPRTFIGQDNDGNYIVGVCTGRSNNQAGMYMEELVDFVQNNITSDLRFLYNADGGGSSAFVVDGTKLNPSTDGSERARPEILYWD